jgi:hypothetical protein
MPVLASYVIDRESIKLDAYRLLCLFYANREIARRSDPVGEFPDAAAKLEEVYFGRELTRLLLSVAVALRTLDDQMQGLPDPDETRVKYMAARQIANNQFTSVLSDSLPLREVCNKIIHAVSVEPLHTDGQQPHEYDEMMMDSWREHRDPDSDAEPPRELGWQHLSGFVGLSGTKGRERWAHVLCVPTFIEAIYVLLSDPTTGWHVEPI